LQGVGGPCCARILTTWFASKVSVLYAFLLLHQGGAAGAPAGQGRKITGGNSLHDSF
jgi:hypothetical protein